MCSTLTWTAGAVNTVQDSLLPGWSIVQYSAPIGKRAGPLLVRPTHDQQRGGPSRPSRSVTPHEQHTNWAAESVPVFVRTYSLSNNNCYTPRPRTRRQTRTHSHKRTATAQSNIVVSGACDGVRCCRPIQFSGGKPRNEGTAEPRRTTQCLHKRCVYHVARGS